MTDDDMDARLRTAGAAWRTATDDARPPVEDLSPQEELRFGRPIRERRRHRTAWLASAAAVVAVLVAGGGFLVGRLADSDHGHRTTAAESAALQDTVWQLLGYGGDQLRWSSLATFYVHDGAFVADDSCELYNGGARIDGGHLRLTDIEDRFYNCTDAVGEITFRQGIKTLQNNPTFSVDGDRLTISGDGPTLHFRAAPNLPAPTPDRPTLTGATWRLTTVTGPDGDAHSVKGNSDFRIDGNHLHASDTCNTLDGTLQIDYPILKLDGLSTTEIGCPQDSLAPLVDQVLSGNVRVDFRDATLTLTKTGAGTLTYQWQPDDEPATDPQRLTATDWKLTAAAGVPASGVTLHVGDGRLEITSQCPSMTADVVVRPGSLTVHGLPENVAAGCPPDVSSVQEMLATGPTLWHIDGKRLVLNHAGSQGFSLVFDPAKDVSAASVELPGTWKLTGVETNDGNSVSGSGSSDSGVTLKLTEHGITLSGVSCGPLSATAELGADVITLGPLAATGTTNCRQTTVTRVFSGAVAWTIQNGQLRLTKGKVTLTFER